MSLQTSTYQAKKAPSISPATSTALKQKNSNSLVTQTHRPEMHTEYSPDIYTSDTNENKNSNPKRYELNPKTDEMLKQKSLQLEKHLDSLGKITLFLQSVSDPEKTHANILEPSDKDHIYDILMTLRKIGIFLNAKLGFNSRLSNGTIPVKDAKKSNLLLEIRYLANKYHGSNDKPNSSSNEISLFAKIKKGVGKNNSSNVNSKLLLSDIMAIAEKNIHQIPFKTSLSLFRI